MSGAKFIKQVIHMKHTLLIFILIFALCSCNLFKRTVEVTTKNEHKEEIEVSKTIDENKDQKKDSTSNTETATHAIATKEQIAKMVAEWSEKDITYDTNKPVDEKTGKPPVLSEKVITYKSNNQTSNEVKEDLSVDKHEKINLKVDSNDETKTKLDSTHKSSDKIKTTSKNTETSSSWWKWLLVGIILSIVGFIYFKLRSILKF